MKIRILSFIALLAVLLSGFVFAQAEEAGHNPSVILYTNDVHCGYKDNIGYAGVAAYKKAYEAAGYETLLVDGGDAIQGDLIGTLSEGQYILDIMNELGYSVSAVGNHELDYGLDTLIGYNEAQKSFDYICCNYLDMEGEPLFRPYVIREIGGWKIAFVGALSPNTMVAEPNGFYDEAGEQIYTLCVKDNGKELYDCIQKSVDAALAEGVDAVIGVFHLGIEYIGEGKPWMSTDVIENTNGIDVVLDAHSHSYIPGEYVKNKDGEEVLLASTGTKLQSLCALSVSENDEGKPEFAVTMHTETLFRDAEMAEFIAGIDTQYEEMTTQIVGHSEVHLITHDPVATDESGNPIRIIRSQETNMGDFAADALRYVSGADVGVFGGGAIRSDIKAGDITYGDVIKCNPYTNSMLTVEVSGQQILDCLELSCSKLPGEFGGFQHVSGVSYVIDMSVESGVKFDENGNFLSVEGERRVKNAEIGGEDIDPEKTYTLAATDYLLKSFGDGMTMFKDCTVVDDSGMLPSGALLKYLKEGLNGIIGEQYAEPYGEGRCTIING